jgi:hypothetical protein
MVCTDSSGSNGPASGRSASSRRSWNGMMVKCVGRYAAMTSAARRLVANMKLAPRHRQLCAPMTVLPTLKCMVARKRERLFSPRPCTGSRCSRSRALRLARVMAMRLGWPVVPEERKIATTSLAAGRG